MTPKFFGVADHNGDELQWPGTGQGFPLRGKPVQLRQTEYDQLRHVVDFQARQFCTWDPLSLAEYVKINDRIANGWYFKKHEDRRWSEKDNGYWIWLEWLEIYGEIPSGKHPDLPT